jgi:hypothetical protein
LGIFFDLIANYLNVDISFITEQVTRSAMSAVFDLPTMLANAQTYLSLDDPTKADYYQGGIVVG